MLKNLDPFAWSLNLLEYIGNNVKTPAETFKIEENIKDAVCNKIGIPTKDRNKNFNYICEMLLNEGLVTSPDKDKTYRRFILTPEGWKKHHAISSGYINTKQGFMAMPFNINEITVIFR